MIPLTMPDSWPQRFLLLIGDFALASRGGPYMAMANKLTRIAWAVMTTGKTFDPARGALAKGAAATA